MGYPIFIRNTPNPNLSSSLSSEFWDLANQSDQIKIAVGYIGANSIIALNEYIELNKNVKLDIFIGMQYIEGFSEKQLYALQKLQATLSSGNSRRGTILVSSRVKHHGKFYLFRQNDMVGAPVSHPRVYIGSANLDTITKGYNKTYEAGLIVEDVTGEFQEYFERHVKPLGTEIDFHSVTPTIQDESPLAQYEEAIPLTPAQLDQIVSEKPGQQFKIPLKAKEKSNLNVFFGKPRISKKTNRALARPWYEVEVMPGKEITTSKGYPQNRTFTVVTDDGWKFVCRTSAPDGKNLRSAGNLMVLGAWIKGRLENYHALKMGEKVSEETFRAYGRSDFDMIYFPHQDVWYFDFGRKE